MALSIDGIKSAFTNGDFARPNLFGISIPSLDRNIEYKCRAAALPAGEVEAIKVSYQNRKFPIAGDRTYPDWTITMYNDAAHSTRQQFIDWQIEAAAMGKSIYGETPDEYLRSASVNQYDRQGEVQATYNLYQIFPTNVGEVQLDWDNNNEVETFEVTFTVGYWTLGDGLTA